VVKRVVDVSVGLVLLVMAVPLILAGAVVSLASHRAWPFYTQERVGLDGRRFRLVKIRTLAPTTPTSLGKYDLEAHRPAAACRFLRAHHLDELPQLLQVVRGSMSLVGPRPEMPALAAELPPAFAELRTQVRPGLTGLWQVSTALNGLIAEAPEYDAHYVRHRTTLLDGWILARTALGLVGGAPIDSLAKVPGWTGAAPAAAERPIEHVAA
jgi:lipopolysaccharide/colanic/teichoic acid biosynthesis glycosyltransferase